MLNLGGDLLKRKRIKLVEQSQHSECGLSCIAMITQYDNVYYSMNELRRIIETGRDGINLHDMREILRNIGYDCGVYKADVKQLEQQFLTNKRPVIVLWNNNHYVVVEKVKKGYFYILDPATGKSKISKENFKDCYNNVVLKTNKSESNITTKKKKSAWPSYLIHLKKIPFLLLTITSLAIVLHLTMLVVPIIIQYLIDNIILQNQVSLLTIFMISIVSLAIVQSGLQYLSGKLIIKLNVFLDKKVIKGFFNHLIYLPYNFFQTRSFGDLLYRASSTTIIRDMMSSQFIVGILNIFSILFIFGYMIYQSYPLALLVLICTTISITFTLLSSSLLKSKNQEEVSARAKTQGFQTEFLYGIFNIKSAGMEKDVLSKWEVLFNRSVETYSDKEKLLNVIGSVNGTLKSISPLIVLWFGAYEVFNGSMTVGALVAFHSLSGQFFSNSESLVNTYNAINITTNYLERIKDIFDEKVERLGGKKINLEGNIKLTNVSFSYNKKEKVLENVNLCINKGEKVAIIGKSGSGKSTLAKVILGLYNVDDGDVYYDDTNINEIDLSYLRKQIGIVPQEVSLFNQTIKYNISLNRDLSSENIEYVSKIAQVYNDIQKMPLKFDTMISEMGLNMSGGQRQRIILARALLNKPSIMLLDEATSSLDYENENKIDEYLKELNCTRVIISHRLSSIQDADKIIELKDGIIINSGDHDYMLENSDYYNSYFISRKERNIDDTKSLVES